MTEYWVNIITERGNLTANLYADGELLAMRHYGPYSKSALAVSGDFAAYDIAERNGLTVDDMTAPLDLYDTRDVQTVQYRVIDPDVHHHPTLDSILDCESCGNIVENG